MSAHLLALLLDSYPTRPIRYAWGVMAWQPSAWPLLNDQDPHTGYMMQVRRRRCAAFLHHVNCAAFLHRVNGHAVAGRAESRSQGRLRGLRVPLL